MSNIFDYIKWRGDLSLNQDKFNEIDNLILSRFAYLPFDNIIKENEIVTVKELNKRFKKEDIDNLPILWKDDVNLFPAMGESKRFGNMLATKYINKIESNIEKQFSAITILLPDDTLYISYRGTDNTLIGWKEDFNMSFKSHVASQVESVKYLEEISKIYSNGIRIGGHSKGGNLAVYASIFAKDEIKDRIINVYNNDGPGFDDDIINTEEYKKIIPKVHTFIPQSSIIGRLLNHEEKYTVIKSTQKGVMQHDLYSWQVIGNKFETYSEVTNGSKFVDKTIKDWVKDVDAEKRELVIDVIYEIINTTEKQTFGELKTNWFTNGRKILKSYKKLDDETKKIVMQVLHDLIRIAKDNIKGNYEK